MMYACGRGWIRWCTEDDACGVEDFETFGMGGVDVIGHCGWMVGVGVGMGSLQKILSSQVWKVRVTNILTKTMQAVWVVRSCHQIG